MPKSRGWVGPKSSSTYLFITSDFKSKHWKVISIPITIAMILLSTLLQLSEADIAILVSAKQQLQLQFHESRSKKQKLGNHLKKYRSENGELRAKLEKTEMEFREFKVGELILLSCSGCFLQNISQQFESAPNVSFYSTALCSALN